MLALAFRKVLVEHHLQVIFESIFRCSAIEHSVAANNFVTHDSRLIGLLSVMFFDYCNYGVPVCFTGTFLRARAIINEFLS